MQRFAGAFVAIVPGLALTPLTPFLDSYPHGLTPLHVAGQRQRLDIVQLLCCLKVAQVLLDAGADLHLRNM